MLKHENQSTVRAELFASSSMAKTNAAPTAVKSPARIRASTLACAMLIPLAVLSGCAGYSKDHFTVGSVQDNYKTRHPIVIDEREQTLDVPVATSSYDLTHASQSAIEGFAFQYRRSASGVITIMLPSGSPNESASRSILEKVISAIGNSGVSREKIRITSYYAAEHGTSAPIRLSYFAVKANVDACGKWPEDLAGSNSDNKNYHNFGCAQQNNLAKMIANPADLLAPRGMSDIDANRRNEVFKDYRDGNIRLPTPRQQLFRQ